MAPCCDSTDVATLIWSGPKSVTVKESLNAEGPDTSMLAGVSLFTTALGAPRDLPLCVRSTETLYKSDAAQLDATKAARTAERAANFL